MPSSAANCATTPRGACVGCATIAPAGRCSRPTCSSLCGTSHLTVGSRSASVRHELAGLRTSKSVVDESRLHCGMSAFSPGHSATGWRAEGPGRSPSQSQNSGNRTRRPVFSTFATGALIDRRYIRPAARPTTSPRPTADAPLSGASDDGGAAARSSRAPQVAAAMISLAMTSRSPSVRQWLGFNARS